ncbi:hypothetical protein P4S73_28350 [Paraglaciecola sp. Hal342]|jgi:hypothetical protein
MDTLKNTEDKIVAKQNNEQESANFMTAQVPVPDMLSISKNTSNKRRPIIFGMFLLAICFVGSLWFSMTELNNHYKLRSDMVLQFLGTEEIRAEVFQMYGERIYEDSDFYKGSGIYKDSSIYKDFEPLLMYLKVKEDLSKADISNADDKLANTVRAIQEIDRLLQPLLLKKYQPAELEGHNIYWIWMKISLSFLGLVSTILYFVKWQNNWAQTHADFESKQLQDRLDLKRAEWIVEVATSCKKDSDNLLSEELLSNFAQNLFSKKNNDNQELIHPSDQLASALLGSASKLRMNIGGNELEINKPGNIKPKQSTS